MSIDVRTDFIAAATDFGPAAATLAGQTITGVLAYPPADAFGIVAGKVLEFHVAAGIVAADPRGQTLVADGVSYTVVEFVDHEGLIVLGLEAT